MVGVAVLFAFSAVDEFTATPGEPSIWTRVTAALVIPLVGIAALLAVASSPAKSRKLGRQTERRQVAAGDSSDPSTATAESRDGDWLNAVVTLGIFLSVPITGSLVFVVSGVQTEAPWVFFLWLLGLYLGVPIAWESWHSLLSAKSLNLNWGEAELSGRTGPIRRVRSIHLDQLTRVGLRMVFERVSFTYYFVLRDRDRGLVMLEDTPEARSTVLRAITLSHSVHVGNLARRQLVGLFTWWLPPLVFLGWMLFLMAVATAALCISVALGATEWSEVF